MEWHQSRESHLMVRISSHWRHNFGTISQQLRKTTHVISWFLLPMSARAPVESVAHSIHDWLTDHCNWQTRRKRCKWPTNFLSPPLSGPWACTSAPHAVSHHDAGPWKITDRQLQENSCPAAERIADSLAGWKLKRRTRIPAAFNSERVILYVNSYEVKRANPFRRSATRSQKEGARGANLNSMIAAWWAKT